MILERNQVGSGPLGFLANPQLSTGLICFINYRLSWASHVIPLSMMSYRGPMLGLKANIFLYPWPLEALDHFVTSSNVMLPLSFHSIGELRIKRMDTNSARSWFEDYRSSWTLCQSLSCFYIGKILQKDASWSFFNEFGLINHQINSFDLSFDWSPCFWYERGNSRKVLQENVLRTFFNEFGLISHQINSFVFFIRSVTIWSDLLSLGRDSIDRTGAGMYAAT